MQYVIFLLKSIQQAFALLINKRVSSSVVSKVFIDLYFSNKYDAASCGKRNNHRQYDNANKADIWHIKRCLPLLLSTIQISP
ncbi:MAG: hypothetical protein NZ824_04670 [Candidatus Thioglobus sp.]|nr:hypothetical protein [Candidatus Thioglobus sp.]